MATITRSLSLLVPEDGWDSDSPLGIADDVESAVLAPHKYFGPRSLDASSPVRLTRFMANEWQRDTDSGLPEVATTDETAPTIDSVLPEEGSLGSSEVVTVNASDEAALSFLLIFVSINGGVREVAYDGSAFGALYTGEANTVNGGEVTLLRDGGWTGAVVMTVTAVDTSGNSVTGTYSWTAPAPVLDMTASIVNGKIRLKFTEAILETATLRVGQNYSITPPEGNPQVSVVSAKYVGPLTVDLTFSGVMDVGDYTLNIVAGTFHSATSGTPNVAGSVPFAGVRQQYSYSL